MRLFVGLQPDEAARAALTELQLRLQDAGVAAIYPEPASLHMTLAFIGEWPENAAGTLPAVKHPFRLTLSHVGLFREARVIWAGTEESEELNQLAQQVRINLTDAGIPFDPKPFVPHFTLARKPVVPEGLDLSGMEVPAAVIPVSDVYLFRSDRGEKGMVYSVIGCGHEQQGR